MPTAGITVERVVQVTANSAALGAGAGRPIGGTANRVLDDVDTHGI